MKYIIFMHARLAYIQIIVTESLKRWLQSINMDNTSKFYGCADREYWAWKTKDFNNGTWQGGLAGFLDAKNLLDIDEEQISYIVEACIIGSHNIQRSNGSYEEAYPYESSLCVTALVVFNLSYSYLQYKHYFSDVALKHLTELLKKALSYLENNTETHGKISNHIATIEFSILLASKVLDQPLDFSRIDQFFDTQHQLEGWFTEYHGADPGYQTLLMHYCNVAIDILNLKNYQKYLLKSLNFISKFAYKNGDFAGEVGARGTAIFYPSCILSDNDYNLTSWFLFKHSKFLGYINPVNIDANNFVPVFNSWSYFLKKLPISEKQEQPISTSSFEYLKDAGFILVNYDSVSTIISFNTGCIKLLKFENNHWVDHTITSFYNDKYTTQGLPIKNIIFKDQFLKFTYQYHLRKHPINTPFKSSIIRLISRLIYRVPLLQRLFKVLLVKLIMSSDRVFTSEIDIELNLKEGMFKININNPVGWKIAKCSFHGHMASANQFSLNYVP
ncbi:MAG: hypothetical protein LN588_04975 [Rickettsia endosymbiont of Bryobia graminum]|nr:hypothetical protein [Rickettsia endosymbiont of Bryobia graminum]